MKLDQDIIDSFNAPLTRSDWNRVLRTAADKAAKNGQIVQMVTFQLLLEALEEDGVPRLALLDGLHKELDTCTPEELGEVVEALRKKRSG